MAQRDRQHLGSAGTWVRSLAWHSGLKIWRCHSRGLGCDRGSDLIPHPKLHMLQGSQEKGGKKKKPSVWDCSPQDVLMMIKFFQVKNWHTRPTSWTFAEGSKKAEKQEQHLLSARCGKISAVLWVLGPFLAATNSLIH